VRERAQRPALLAFTLASVVVGLVVLRLLHAPRDLFALMVAMVAGMAITLLVSTFWKISIHASCVAGAITSLALLVDARAWWLSPLVLATAWSRMLLRHHSLAQVAAGTFLGAVAAEIGLSILTWPPHIATGDDLVHAAHDVARAEHERHRLEEKQADEFRSYE